MQADIGIEACMNKSVCVGSVRPPAMNNMSPCKHNERSHKQSSAYWQSPLQLRCVSAVPSYVEEVEQPHDEKVEFGKRHAVVFAQILQQQTPQAATSSSAHSASCPETQTTNERINEQTIDRSTERKQQQTYTMCGLVADDAEHRRDVQKRHELVQDVSFSVVPES